MALSGAYVSFVAVVIRNGASLPADISWHEPYASGVLVTQNKAPSDGMIEVGGSIDVWVTYGPTPADPSLSSSARIPVLAGSQRQFFVKQGYRVALSAA